MKGRCRRMARKTAATAPRSVEGWMNSKSRERQRKANKLTLAEAVDSGQGRAYIRPAMPVYEPPKDLFRQLVINYRQLAEIAGNPELKQRMLDMAAHYEAK